MGLTLKPPGNDHVAWVQCSSLLPLVMLKNAYSRISQKMTTMGPNGVQYSEKFGI